MYRKSLIAIEWETRENMKDVATKRQTYDNLINELLILKKEKESEKSK